MNRRRTCWRGFAGPVTFSVLYTVCALAVVLFPHGAMGFGNAWPNGLDSTLLDLPGGRPPTPGQQIYVLVSAATVSFVVGASLAGHYNVFARVSTGVKL